MRNTGVKGHSGDISDVNAAQVTRKDRKGHPCGKTAKNPAGLCASILWKVPCLSHEMGGLAEEISKQSLGGAAWFLPNP